MDDALIKPTGKYREAMLNIEHRQLCYSPHQGFGLSLAGALALGDETMKVSEMTLCVAGAAGLSSRPPRCQP